MRPAPAITTVILEKWRYNAKGIDAIVCSGAFSPSDPAWITELMWDMHLIHHRFDKHPHKRGRNRFAGLPAKHPDVRVGDAVAYFEHTSHGM